MLLEALKTLVTAEQFVYITDELGVEDDGDVKLLTLERLMKAGLKEIKAEKVMRELGIAPSSASGPITVRLDKGDRAVTEINDPAELLAVLTAEGRSLGDKKAAARKLDDLGRRIVVAKDNRQEVLSKETVQYWELGSLTTRHWGRENNPIVSATNLFESNELVEIDPYEVVVNRRFVALDNGYNAESGADWTDVSMHRRALLVDAALQGEQVATGDSVTIAEVLSQETLRGKWRVLDERADSTRLEEIERNLKVPRSSLLTPESAGMRSILVALVGRQSSAAQSGGPVGGGNANRRNEFLAFLGRGFDAFGVRQLDYEMRSELPGATASFNQVAGAFVDLAERTGKVNDPSFWTRIMTANTGRAREARTVAAMYGVTNL